MSRNGGPAVDRLQPRRWRVLAALRSVDSPATVDEITDVLHENRAPSDPLAGLESWDRTHQRVHEVDLPALHAAGLVDFDQERGLVTIPRGAARLEIEASAAEDDERDGSSSAGPATVSGLPSESSPERSHAPGGIPWRYVYLGGALASVALVASTTVLLPDDRMAAIIAAGVVAALFAVLAAGHVLLDQ